MFWAGTLVLLTVTSAVSPAAAAPARVVSSAPTVAASTYDDATCATDGEEPGAPSDLLAVEERDWQRDKARLMRDKG